MDEAPARNFGPKVALGFVSDAMGGDSHENELFPYHDEENDNDLDFAYVPVDSHVHFRTSPLRFFDAIRKLCRPTNVTVPDDPRVLFSLA